MSHLCAGFRAKATGTAALCETLDSAARTPRGFLSGVGCVCAWWAPVMASGSSLALVLTFLLAQRRAARGMARGALHAHRPDEVVAAAGAFFSQQSAALSYNSAEQKQPQ